MLHNNIADSLLYKALYFKQENNKGKSVLSIVCFMFAVIALIAVVVFSALYIKGIIKSFISINNYIWKLF